MANGLGAGFAGLTLLAVEGALAVALALTGGVAVAARRRAGRVPPAAQSVALGLLAVVLAVAAVAVVALADEARTLAWLVAALVVLPLAVAGWYVDRSTSLSLRAVAATTAVAWSVPFLFGTVATLAALPVVARATGQPPAAAGGTWLPWVLATVGGSVVAVTTAGISERLPGLEAARSAGTGDRASGS
jgi:hypothetical protein